MPQPEDRKIAPRMWKMKCHHQFHLSLKESSEMWIKIQTPRRVEAMDQRSLRSSVEKFSLTKCLLESNKHLAAQFLKILQSHCPAVINRQTRRVGKCQYQDLYWISMEGFIQKQETLNYSLQSRRRRRIQRRRWWWWRRRRKRRRTKEWNSRMRIIQSVKPFFLQHYSVGIDVQRIEQLQQKETKDEPADEMVEDFWNRFVHHIVLFPPFLPALF